LVNLIIQILKKNKINKISLLHHQFNNKANVLKTFFRLIIFDNKDII